MSILSSTYCPELVVVVVDGYQIEGFCREDFLTASEEFIKIRVNGAARTTPALAVLSGKEAHVTVKLRNTGSVSQEGSSVWGTQVHTYSGKAYFQCKWIASENSLVLEASLSPNTSDFKYEYLFEEIS